jgi:subtilisin family serine protease
VSFDGQRMTYSSCGPNSAQPKPDLVAPVPFPSLWRARPFSGTSASAPQAAALAALWWSRYPGWTAAQVRLALTSSARDLGPPGHDYETGYGLITLPK